MPNTTPNRGYRIPKTDGTDPIQPDDVRVPITSIDTDVASNITRLTAVEGRATTLEKTHWIDYTGSTSAGGHLVINHGQNPVIPVGALVQIWHATGGSGYVGQVTGIDANNVTVQILDTAGSPLVSTTLHVTLVVRNP